MPAEGQEEFLDGMIELMLKMMGEKKARKLVDKLWGSPKVEIRETGV